MGRLVLTVHVMKDVKVLLQQIPEWIETMSTSAFMTGIVWITPGLCCFTIRFQKIAEQRKEDGACIRLPRGRGGPRSFMKSEEQYREDILSSIRRIKTRYSGCILCRIFWWWSVISQFFLAVFAVCGNKGKTLNFLFDFGPAFLCACAVLFTRYIRKRIAGKYCLDPVYMLRSLRMFEKEYRFWSLYDVVSMSSASAASAVLSLILKAGFLTGPGRGLAAGIVPLLFLTTLACTAVSAFLHLLNRRDYRKLKEEGCEIIRIIQADSEKFTEMFRKNITSSFIVAGEDELVEIEEDGDVRLLDSGLQFSNGLYYEGGQENAPVSIKDIDRDFGSILKKFVAGKKGFRSRSKDKDAFTEKGPVPAKKSVV